MINFSNWLFGLISYFSPSVYIDLNGKVAGGTPTSSPALMQSQINEALKLALKQNPITVGTNQPAKYTPNPFTSSQIARTPFQSSPGMMQAYNNKMQGYGIAPQPFAPSASAPTKGGK